MNKKAPSFYKHLDFLIVDEIALFVSFCVAYVIRLNTLKDLFNSIQYRNLLLVCLIINICVTYFLNPHKNILKRPFLTGTFELLKMVIVELLCVSFFLFATKQSELISRLFVGYTYLSFALIAFVLRYIQKKIVIASSKNENANYIKKILIITHAKRIDEICKDLSVNNYGNNKVAGFCILDKNLKETKIEQYDVIANKEDVLSYLCHNWIDEVYIATNYRDVPKEIYDGLATAGITTNILTDRIEEFSGQEHSMNKLFNKTVSTFSIKIRKPSEILLKRLLDIIGGLVGSLITLILALFIGPIIYIKSPGPIFYKQERIGQNGKRFYIYKFRSMIMNADALKESLQAQNRIKDGMMFKIKNDPRIIPGIGDFIRRTSIDEFPQFFNVVKGEMSLVGTRPPTVDEWVKYKLEHRIRMAIKPGITGLWQVNGRSKITDFNKVIEFDTKYINNWTLGLDIEILVKTVIVLLFSKREDEAM